MKSLLDLGLVVATGCAAASGTGSEFDRPCCRSTPHKEIVA